jgi:cobalt/nickel transport system permease protein
MQPFHEHCKKDHLLSDIDARIKLIVSIVLLLMVLSYKGFAFPLIVAILGFCLCLGMKIPLRVFALRFSEPFFIVLVLVVLKCFFSGSNVMFSFNLLGLDITGHKDGLIDGLMIACRITGAVSIAAVLGFSTPFTGLMAGLSWLRVPKDFIEVLMFAYRYIFVLFEDALIIYNAQKNRLGYSSVRRGLSSFGTLAGSLTLKAFENSQNTTLAMVQRGYNGDMPMLKHQPFKACEVACSLVFIIFMGAIWTI